MEIGVSVRTVYRDLAVLELAGVPWYFDSDSRRYKIHEHFAFPAIGLTPEEQIGQALASVLFSAFGRPLSSGHLATTDKLVASSKIQSSVLQDALSYFQVLAMQMSCNDVTGEIASTLQSAIRHRVKVSCVYASPFADGVEEFRLVAYRLAFLKSNWYVIGKADSWDDSRIMRISRFTKATLTTESASPPSDFDLTAFLGNAWGVYRGANRYEIVLRFSERVARRIVETRWHASQVNENQSDGSVIVRFSIDGLEEITRWILSWTGDVEVVAPSELRDATRQKHAIAIELAMKEVNQRQD